MPDNFAYIGLKITVFMGYQRYDCVHFLSVFILYKTPFTRYRYETLPVKNHYVFNYSHGTGRVILVTTFVHFIIEIRTLKCFP